MEEGEIDLSEIAIYGEELQRNEKPPLKAAVQLAEEFYDELGVREIEFETYYDHCLACRVVEHKVGKPQKIIFD